MKIEKIYLVGVNKNAFRAGEQSLIIGVKMITLYKQGIVDIPEEPRICYHVQFEDMTEDYVPKSEVDNGNYEIITLNEIIKDGLPEIIY